ncbi:hypothetical protein TrVE_jg5679, partial [Triparma verrucosa]
VEMDTKVQTSFVVAQWSPVVDMINITVTGDIFADEDTVARIKISDIDLIDTDGSEQMSLYLVAQNPSAGSSALELVEVSFNNITEILTSSTAVLIDGSLIVQGGVAGEYVLDTKIEGSLVEGDSSGSTYFAVYELPPSIGDSADLSFYSRRHFSGLINVAVVAVMSDGAVSETGVTPIQVEFLPVADDFILYLPNQVIDEGGDFILNVTQIVPTDADLSEVLELNLTITAEKAQYLDGIETEGILIDGHLNEASNLVHFTVPAALTHVIDFGHSDLIHIAPLWTFGGVLHFGVVATVVDTGHSTADTRTEFSSFEITVRPRVYQLEPSIPRTMDIFEDNPLQISVSNITLTDVDGSERMEILMLDPGLGETIVEVTVTSHNGVSEPLSPTYIASDEGSGFYAYPILLPTDPIDFHEWLTVTVVPYDHYSGDFDVIFVTNVTDIADGLVDFVQFDSPCHVHIEPVIDFVNVRIKDKAINVQEDEVASFFLRNLTLVDFDSETMDVVLLDMGSPFSSGISSVTFDGDVIEPSLAYFDAKTGDLIVEPLDDVNYEDVNYDDEFGYSYSYSYYDLEGGEFGQRRLTYDSTTFPHSSSFDVFGPEFAGGELMNAYLMPKSGASDAQVIVEPKTHFGGKVEVAVVYTMVDSDVVAQTDTLGPMAMTFGVEVDGMANFTLNRRNTVKSEGQSASLLLNGIDLIDADNSETVEIFLVDTASISDNKIQRVTIGDSEIEAETMMDMSTGNLEYSLPSEFNVYKLPADLSAAELVVTPMDFFSGAIDCILVVRVTDISTDDVQVVEAGHVVSFFFAPVVNTFVNSINVGGAIVAEDTMAVAVLDDMALLDQDGSETLTTYLIELVPASESQIQSVSTSYGELDFFEGEFSPESGIQEVLDGSKVFMLDSSVASFELGVTATEHFSGSIPCYLVTVVEDVAPTSTFHSGANDLWVTADVVTFTFTPVADAPALVVSGTVSWKTSENLPFTLAGSNVVLTATDQDSESLSMEITTAKHGDIASLSIDGSIITPVIDDTTGVGVYSVPLEFTEMIITPVMYYSGDIPLIFVGRSTEISDSSALAETIQEVILHVTAIATTPIMNTYLNEARVDEDESFGVVVEELGLIDTDGSESLFLRLYCDSDTAAPIYVNGVPIYKTNSTDWVLDLMFEIPVERYAFDGQFPTFFEVPVGEVTPPFIITNKARQDYSGTFGFRMMAIAYEPDDDGWSFASVHTDLSIEYRPVVDPPLFTLQPAMTIAGRKSDSYNPNKPILDYTAPLKVTSLGLKDTDGSEVLSVTLVTNTTGLEAIYVNGEVLAPSRTVDKYDPDIFLQLPIPEVYTGTRYYDIPQEFVNDVLLLPALDFGGQIEIHVFASSTELATGDTASTQGVTFLDIVGVDFSKKSVFVAEGKFRDSFSMKVATAPVDPVYVYASSLYGGCTIEPAMHTFTSQDFDQPHEFVIVAYNDKYMEEDVHTDIVELTVETVDPMYSGMVLSDITVNIKDDDIAGWDLEENGSEPLTILAEEADNYVEYSFKLTCQPKNKVQIVVNGADDNGVVWSYYEGLPADYVEGSTMVYEGYNNMTVFNTATDWQIFRTVRLYWGDDFVSGETFTNTITHTFISDDIYFDDFAVGDVTLTVEEDDQVGVLVSTSSVAFSPVGELLLTTDQAGEPTLEDKYFISLASEPSSDVVVNVGGFSSLTSVTPQSLTFTSSNWDVAQKVKLSATATDDLGRVETLTHSIASTDAKYSSISIASCTANVMTVLDKISPPTVSYGLFADNGGGATLFFAGSYDPDTGAYYGSDQAGKSGIWPCEELLDLEAMSVANEGRHMGDGPTCSWADNLQLAITFAFGPTILPGDSLNVKAEVLKSEWSEASLYMTAGGTVLMDPENPVSPDTKISAVAEVGICDELTMDGSQTGGGAGRDMQYRWRIESAWPEHDLVNITTFFDNVNAAEGGTGVKKLEGEWAVRRDLMKSDTQYTFRLQAINFFGTKSNAYHSVVKTSLPAPVAKFQGTGVFDVAKGDDVSLMMDASIPVMCPGVSIDLSATKMGFTFVETTGNLAALGLTVQDLATRNVKKLSIDGGTLTPNTNYVFEGTAYLLSNELVKSTASVEVRVGRQPLVAVIAGGDRLAGTDQSFDLDASGSRDPDELLQADDIYYTWTCSSWDAEASYNPDTETYVGAYVENSCSGSVESYMTKGVKGGHQVLFPQGSLTAGLLKFTCYVSDAGGDSSGLDGVPSASVHVEVKSGEPPIVAIEALAQAKYNANEGEYMEIVANAQAKGAIVSREWQMIEGDGNVADIFYSPLDRGSMIVSLGHLTSGSTYVFKYTVYDNQGADSFGSSSVTVYTNLPPSSGKFEITPSTGVVMQDEFNFVADIWQDDDLPLSYAFKYIIGKDTASATEVAMGDWSPTTSKSSLLPLGDANNNFAVTGIVYVADKYGSSIRKAFEVNCTELVLADDVDMTEFLADASENLVGSALDSGDPEAAAQALGAVAGMLNSVSDAAATEGGGDDGEDDDAYYYDNYEYEEPDEDATLSPTPSPTTPAPTEDGATRSPTLSPTPSPTEDPVEVAKRAALRASLLESMTATAAITDVSEAAMEQQSNVIASVCAAPAELTPAAQEAAMGLVGGLMTAALEGGVAVSQDTAKAGAGALSSLTETDMFSSGEEGERRMRRHRRMTEKFENGEVDWYDSGEIRRLADEAAMTAAADLKNTMGDLSSGMLQGSLAGMPPKTVMKGNIRLANERREPTELGEVSLPQSRREMRKKEAGATFEMPSGFADGAGFGDLSCMDTQASSLATNPYQSNGQPLNSDIQSLSLMGCASDEDGERRRRKLARLVGREEEEVERRKLATDEKGYLVVEELSTPISMVIPRAQTSNKLLNGTCAMPGQVLEFECEQGVQLFNCSESWRVSQEAEGKSGAWAEGLSFSVNFECGGPTCQYYDTDSQTWSKEGCVEVGRNESVIQCECTHLTEFASRLEAVAQMANAVLSLAGSLTLDDVLNNLVVLITLVVLYSVFILGCIYGRYLDKKDMFKEELLTDDDVLKDANALTFFGAWGKSLETRDRFGAVQMCRDWWREMKDNHKVLSVIYGTKDIQFSRPQRLTVLLLMIMSQMFANAFLYIVKGIEEGQTSEEKMVDQIIFGIGAAVFATPPAIVVALLYKKAGRVRAVENAFVDMDEDKIPEGIKEEVMDRKDVVLAERELFSAQKALKDTKANLILALQKSYFAHYGEGSTDIAGKEKIAFKKDFDKSIEVCKTRIVDAKNTLNRVVVRERDHTKERKRQVTHEINQGLNDLKGIMNIIKKFKKKMKLSKEKKEELQKLRLSEEEKLLLEAEEKQLEKLDFASKMLYKVLLAPFKDLHKKKETPKLLPEWVNYIVYLISFGWCAWCFIYVSLFSIFVNSCKDCGCGLESCVNCDLVAGTETPCTGEQQGWFDDDGFDRCMTCPEAMTNKPNANIGEAWLMSLIFAMISSFVISQPISIFMSKALLPQIAYKFVKGKWKKIEEEKDLYVTIKDEHEVLMKSMRQSANVVHKGIHWKNEVEAHKKKLAQAGITVDDEAVEAIIVKKKESKRKRRRRKKKGGEVVPMDLGEEESGEKAKEEKEETEEEMEDVRKLGGDGAGEQKERTKLDVNPLKNATRANIKEGEDPDEVVDSYDFGYNVGDDNIAERQEAFKKEAKLTKELLELRQPVDDAGAGRTADLMDLFVEGDEEDEEDEDGVGGMEGVEAKKEEEEEAKAKEEETEGGEKEEEVKKTDEEIEKEAAALEKKAQDDVLEVTTNAPEPKPQWRDPSTGKVVDVEQRRQHLRQSKAYRECWDSVLARCVQDLGKSELEKRIAKVSVASSKHSTPSMAFCALAECNGVAEHAIIKLQLPGYREEMKLAEEVCDVAQYVRVNKSPKKKKTPEKQLLPKGESPKKKRKKAASPKAKGAKGKEEEEGEAFWRDPVTGDVMDAEARKQHLLASASYKSCWEEVLGKLVQSAGDKGGIEKDLGRICGVVKGVTPEIAFCSLAECSGVVQHSIVKLRHPGYVEEMKIAVEVCNVSQYVRVQKKAKKASKKA